MSGYEIETNYENDECVGDVNCSPETQNRILRVAKFFGKMLMLGTVLSCVAHAALDQMCQKVPILGGGEATECSMLGSEWSVIHLKDSQTTDIQGKIFDHEVRLSWANALNNQLKEVTLVPTSRPTPTIIPTITPRPPHESLISIK